MRRDWSPAIFDHQMLSHLTPKASDSVDQKIPRVIYQTWKTRQVSKNHYQAMMSWSRLNPEYHYYFYDDQMCRKFLQDNYPTRVLKCYDALKSGAFKADLFRYCLLYKKGGIYIDCSHECKTPLREMIKPNDKFISCKDISVPSWIGKHFHLSPEGVFNAFICCTPGHPFMKKAIDMCINNIMKRSKTENVFAITGPNLLGQAINLVVGRQKHDSHKVGDFQINGYQVKLHHHSLLHFLLLNKRAIFDCDNNRKKLTEVYPGYSAERKKATGTYYFDLYKNNKVFTH